MLRIFDTSGGGGTRREFLGVGTAALGGLGLPGLLASKVSALGRADVRSAIGLAAGRSVAHALFGRLVDGLRRHQHGGLEPDRAAGCNRQRDRGGRRVVRQVCDDQHVIPAEGVSVSPARRNFTLALISVSTDCCVVTLLTSRKNGLSRYFNRTRLSRNCSSSVCEMA